MNRRLSLATALVALAALFPAVAQAASPWWHVDQATRPAHIDASRTAGERQEIATSAGAVFKLAVEGHEVGCFNLSSYAPCKLPSTAANVRAALEKAEAYGPGNVEVTGGPSGTPLIVTTVGEDLGREVPPLEASALSGEAEAKVLSAAVPAGVVVIRATNVGDAPVNAEAEPVVLQDTLPAGLEAVSIEGTVYGTYPDSSNPSGYNIGPHGEVSCQLATTACAFTEPTYKEELLPYGALAVTIGVNVEAGAPSGGENLVSVSGGGAPPTPFSAPLAIAEGPVPFGVSSYEARPEEAGGAPATAAGSHPFQLTTSFDLNRTGESFEQPAQPRDLAFSMPAGFVGNVASLPQCTAAQFTHHTKSAVTDDCPDDSAVGLADLVTKTSAERLAKVETEGPVPVFNLTPDRGEPARFGMFIAQVPIVLNTSVRAGSDYGVDVTVSNLPQSIANLSTLLTLWGDPADHAHDSQRGWDCLELEPSCEAGEGSGRAMLTMPSSCSAPFASSLAARAWPSPSFLAPFPSSFSEPLDGCNAEPFAPSLQVTPESHAAASPSGLTVKLQIPQRTGEAPAATASADLKDATVTLPQGVSVNPSSANGLGACTEAQVGYIPGTSGPAEFTSGPAQCPDQAKIGTVEVLSPLLTKHDEPTVLHPLTGSVYVAKPHENPFGSLLAIYLTVNDPESGIVLKLPGKVTPDPATGQLTTTFSDNPQLPFSEFKLRFFGGNQAALKTPETCGTFQTTSTMVPWSAPEGADAHPASSFTLAEGPAGGGCAHSAGEEPNGPSFSAGTQNPIAGAYSPFVLHLKREDGTQQLSKIETVLPPGMIGKLAGVSYCPEAAIAAAAAKSGREEQASPSCPASSEVGTVTVGSGAGPEPYYVTGHAYLTGPYEGAPLGLAIVTPAVAGPYDLGDVVVRAALHIDPYTTQITVTSDPIPQILQGIPLDVRSIAVNMTRPEFTLNPTSCEAMSVGGSVTSTLGAAAPLSDRFQVGECAKLAFKPHLSFRLKGATKRAGHPALTAWLKMPPGGANVAFAQVSLPHTELLDQGNLDKVCKQAEIASASCPPSSIYGYAKAWSPLLAEPLEGPVFLGVGYGHKLPDLVAELSGQIRVLLHGRVDTDKAGGIRNTFEVVPDAPVSRFMLHLKGGKRYGLIENGGEGLCGRPEHAAARFVGHNGRVAHMHPKIITSCKKHKKRHHKGHHGHHRSRGHGHKHRGKR